MRITEIEVLPIVIPMAGDYHVQYGTIKEYQKVVVRMRTDTGLEGFGDSTAFPFWGWTLEGLVTTIRDIYAPPLIGEDPTNIRRLHHLMDTAATAVAANIARAPLDIAAYDVTGKALGVPVSTLLGGAVRDRIPVVFSTVELGSPESSAAGAKKCIDMGFKQLKVKGGEDASEDVRRIAAIREAVGREPHLRLDVNEGYPDALVAIQALRAMEQYGLDLVESPLPRTDILGLAEIRKKVNVPITIHQGLESPEDAVNLIRMQAADGFTVAVPTTGGLYNASRIVTLAECFRMPVLIGSSAEYGISTAAAAHLASTVKHLPYASDCRFQLRFIDDVLTTPMRIEEGFTYVPSGPGLGVEVDEAKLAKYRVG